MCFFHLNIYLLFLFCFIRELFNYISKKSILFLKFYVLTFFVHSFAFLFCLQILEAITSGSSWASVDSYPTMKQPRLPGAEKFKFANQAKTIRSFSLSKTNQKQRLSTVSQSSEPPFIFHSRTSPSSSQNELSTISSTMSVPVLNRADSKRRAVLPITCKKTSRMLNNTNMELNVDPADLVSEDVMKPRLDTNRVPSCPNLETSSRSLTSSKSSLDTYFRKMSLQNPTIREIPSNFDWQNIRASPSRLSASCSSSCSSEENVWVLREDV